MASKTSLEKIAEPRGMSGLPVAWCLVRSKRKTLAIEVRPGVEVVVRAPLRLPLREIEAFVNSRRAWIEKHWHRPAAKPPEYTRQEEQALRKAARAQLPGLVAYYAGLLGVSPGRITITGARTRFGSCSMKGNLSFSFRLMAYPQSAIEYVVLHEVAHLKQLNHSPAFYALVGRHLPDYRERARLLKQSPISPSSREEEDVHHHRQDPPVRQRVPDGDSVAAGRQEGAGRTVHHPARQGALGENPADHP